PATQNDVLDPQRGDGNPETRRRGNRDPRARGATPGPPHRRGEGRTDRARRRSCRCGPRRGGTCSWHADRRRRRIGAAQSSSESSSASVETGRPDPASWLGETLLPETSTLGPGANPSSLLPIGDRLRPVTSETIRGIYRLHLTSGASRLYNIQGAPA